MYTFKPLIFIENVSYSNYIPKPRSGHRIVCNDTYLYSFGGFNPTIPDNDPQILFDEIWSYSKPLFKEIWKLNITTKEWSLIQNQPALPSELASMAVTLKGNVLIIHGGTACPFGEHNSNETYFCNIIDGKIHALHTSGDKPEPQYGQAILCDGKYFYSIGGTNGYNYTCDIHRLDLTTNIWEAVYICAGKEPCEPAGRYRHEIAFDGRRIFVLGGGTSEDTFSLNELPTFDIISNKWSNLITIADAGYPSPRRCHGVVQYTDETTRATYAVISGGFNERHVLNDIWKLNLQTLQWTHMPQILPRPVYFHSSAITPSGCMFTFGGITKYYQSVEDERKERTNAVHSIWLVLPRLTEICWLALNFYHPDLKYLTNDHLLKVGIPLKFIKRLKGEVDTS